MFKNENKIKDMIVAGHRRGICDRNGDSVKNGNGVFVAKPAFGHGSTVSTFICRKGKMVLKDG